MSAPEQPAGGEPPVELELHPLEVHLARVQAELQRTQLVMSLTSAAAVLAALVCLYTARSGVPRPGGAP